MGVGMKFSLSGPGQLTNIAAMPMYGQNLDKLLLWNQTSDDFESWYQHRVLKYYQVCSNDDPVLTLTCFTTMSNLFPNAFVRDEGKIMDFLRT